MSVASSNLPKSPESSWNDRTRRPRAFDRNIRGLLNKITTGSFASISAQIVSLVNGLDGGDAQILLHVVQLVYEHGIDGVAFCAVYARLCQTLTEHIRPNIADDSESVDKSLAGGQLFRKYLLDHCQNHFERLWDPTLEASLIPIRVGGRGAPGGERVFSDEYYVTQKAKRRRRGLVRFVGELYKLQMLTDKVVHDCIMHFLKDDAPGEEDVESLCMLLSVVGQSLVAKAPLHMNAYFERVEVFANMGGMSFRAKSMLMDLVELRQRNWVARSVFMPHLPSHEHETQIARQRVQRDR